MFGDCLLGVFWCLAMWVVVVDLDILCVVFSLGSLLYWGGVWIVLVGLLGVWVN